MKRLLGPVALGCLFMLGCQRDANPRAEAETHWLDQCADDAECGGGLCVCGVCTNECDAADRCEVAARPACANVRQLALVCGQPIAACVRECVVADDCGAGDFECRDGVCAASDAPPGGAPDAMVPEPQPEGEPAPPAEPEAQPEAQPEPQPEPEVDDCAAACNRVVECYDPLCGPLEDPDALRDGCLVLCAGQPALIPFVENSPTCDGLIELLVREQPAFGAACPWVEGPAVDDCGDACRRLATCSNAECEDGDFGSVDWFDACLGTCADAPAIIAIVNNGQDCAGVIDNMSAADPEYAAMCGGAPEPEPDDLEVACANACDRVIGCLQAECGAPPPGVQGDCHGACLGAPERFDLDGAIAECAALVAPLADDPIFAGWCPPAPEGCPEVAGELLPGAVVGFDTEGAALFDSCDREQRPVVWYAFELAAESTVLLTTEGDGIDTVLALRRDCAAAGEQCNDDGGPGPLSRIETRVPAGRHIVGVRAFDGGAIRGSLHYTVLEGLECWNGVDDDGDGLIDFPLDPQCVDENDDSEGLPAACFDRVDNDGDGLIDLDDPGCDGRADDDETDPAPRECGNGIDDDGDGLIDFPADPDCTGVDDLESHSCAAPIDVGDVPMNGVVEGQLAADGANQFTSTCGGAGLPDAVYRYRVAPGTGRLTVSADNPGTEQPVRLAIRRRCAFLASELACVAPPAQEVVIDDPAAGDYYIIVDGQGQSPGWAPGAGALEFDDPQNYQVSDDIRPNGWADAGRDAFDGFGRTQVTAGGVTVELDVSLGVREARVGPIAVEVTSELINNTWRLHLASANAAEVDIDISGNLGSDAANRVRRGVRPVGGVDVPWLRTSDNFGMPGDPPVTIVMLPSRALDVGALSMQVNADNVLLEAPGVRLPFTLYVTPSYADEDVVLDAIFGDVQDNGEVPPEAVGAFELRVTAE